MNWLTIAALGGIVGLDGTSLGQVMISRPLVAGALAGAALGRPAEGVVLGLILETFALVVLPIGAARYPESGTAAVAAVSAYALAAPPTFDAGLLLLALVFGLAWETVTGPSVSLVRRVNARLLHRAESGVATAGWLERRHLAAIGLDFARGATLTSTGAAAGAALLLLLGGRSAFDGLAAIGAMAAAATAMLAASLGLFDGWSRRRTALLVGLACGSLLLLIR